jgi:hypothetical protein
MATQYCNYADARRVKLKAHFIFYIWNGSKKFHMVAKNFFLVSRPKLDSAAVTGSIEVRLTAYL